MLRPIVRFTLFVTIAHPLLPQRTEFASTFWSIPAVICFWFANCLTSVIIRTKVTIAGIAIPSISWRLRIAINLVVLFTLASTRICVEEFQWCITVLNIVTWTWACDVIIMLILFAHWDSFASTLTFCRIPRHEGWTLFGRIWTCTSATTSRWNLGCWAFNGFWTFTLTCVRIAGLNSWAGLVFIFTNALASAIAEPRS